MEPDPSSSQPASAHAGKLVLVVDDEPNVRTLVRAVLERAGLRVLEAADGMDALRLLQTVKPDLLLTDIMMPNMNGIELADEAARKLPDVPVLLMSGYASGAAQAGKRGFFGKPFAPKALLQIVLQNLGLALLAHNVQTP